MGIVNNSLVLKTHITMFLATLGTMFISESMGVRRFIFPAWMKYLSS